MGFNQHTRGTWVNNMIYNVHLLVGKISTPGSGPVLAHRPALRLRHAPVKWAPSPTACRPTWW